MNHQQYDELTGLEKRDVVLRRIKSLINDNKEFHIIFTDIDFFKSINDNFGHKRGDEILKDVATFLKQLVNDDEIVSRWGGDEFLILINNNPIEFSQKISELLMGKKFIGEPELSISLSFGIASFPKDGKDFETLYDFADKNMYEFKKKRRWRGRIIGRRLELSKIRKMLDNVSRGSSHLLNIYGPKGVGKTRIIQEAAIYAQIIGFDVKIIDGNKREEFFEFLDENSFSNVEERVIIKLKELAEKKPLFFIIDNIDYFTELIDVLKKNTKKIPKIFFLVASLKKLEGLPNLKIHNLDIYETGELIEGLFGSRHFKDDLINFVYRESKGNPQEIINIVRHFINTGEIEKINFDRYNYTEVILQKFKEEFDDDEKNVLKIITLLGKNYTPEVVAELTCKDEFYVSSVLEKAENSGIFIEKVKDLLKEDAQNYYKDLAEYFSKKGKSKLSGDFFNYAGMFEKSHIEYLRYLDEVFGKFLPEEYKEILEKIEKYQNEEWFRKKEFYLKKGDYYYRIGELKKSIEFFDKALDIDCDKETMLKKAKTLAKLGEMKTAYEILNNIGDIGLPFLAEIFMKVGDIERAYIIATKAVENLKEPDYLMEAYAALGGVNIKMRDYDKGIKNLERALLIANYMDNKHWASIINNRIAAIFFLKSNYTTSKIYYEKSLQGFKSIGDIYSVINVYINLGLVYEKEGDLNAAMNFYNEALRLSKISSFDYLEGESIGNLGRIFSIKGDNKKAIEYMLISIDIMKRVKSLENLFELYCEIISILLKEKKFEDAKTYIIKAKKIAYELKSDILKKKILIYEAHYNILTGRPSVSLGILEKIKNTQFKELKGDILILLALAYDNLNDTRNASFYGTKALKFYKENNSILEIISCYDKLSNMRSFEKDKEHLKNFLLELKRRLEIYEI